MVHAFNSTAQEAEAGGSLNVRPAWSVEPVPGQSGLHRETLSQKQTNTNLIWRGLAPLRCRGLERWLSFKSTYCFCRGPEFGSQHLHQACILGTSQQPVIPATWIQHTNTYIHSYIPVLYGYLNTYALSLLVLFVLYKIGVACRLS